MRTGAEGLFHGRDPRPFLARLAWLSATGLTVGGILGWARQDFGTLPVSEAGGAATLVGCAVVAMIYATVGVLLANRGRGQLTGWLFLALGVGLATVLPANVIVAAAHAVLRPVSLPTLAIAWWVSTVTLPLYAALLAATLLTFPAGRFLDRSSSAILASGCLGAALLVAAVGVDPAGIRWYPSLANPLGVTGVGPMLLAGRLLGGALEVGAMLGACGSLVIRFRRADDASRAQLRWVGSAAALAAVAAAPAMIGRYTPLVEPSLGQTLMLVAMVGESAIPVAAGIAIFRHHLYDIEVVIDRSLVYVPLMGLLGGLYAGSVALSQRAFVALTGDTSDLAIVVSSLLIAWVFTPLRRHLEGMVDRHMKVARKRGGQDPGSTPAADLRTEMRELELRTCRLETMLRSMRSYRRRTVDVPADPAASPVSLGRRALRAEPSMASTNHRARRTVRPSGRMASLEA